MAGETKTLQFADGVAVEQPAITSHEVTTLTVTEQASAPSTPASGQKVIYAKTDGKLYTRDDAGIDSEVGSGSGGGSGKNYVSNPSASSDTTGWTTSNATIDRTTEAANLPRGNTTGSAFEVTSSTDGGYVAWRLSLDAADLQAANLLYKLAAKVADSDVWKLEAYWNDASDYSGSYSEIPLTNDDSSGDTFLPAATLDYTTHFTPLGNAYLELRIVHVGAVSNTIYFSDVLAGPGIASAVTPVGPWTAYTPTITGFGTHTVTSAHWRQVGESAEISIKFTSGTSTAVTAQIGLPSGLTTRALGGVTEIVGKWYRDSSTATAIKDGAVLAPNTSQTYVWLSRHNDDAAVGPFTASLGSALLLSGEACSVVFTVPIAEWAGAVNYQMSDSVTYANARARYSLTSNSGAIPASGTTMKYTTEEYDNFDGYDSSTGEYTVPATGEYHIEASVYASAAVSSSEYINIGIYVNGSIKARQLIYGQRAAKVSATLSLAQGEVVTVLCLTTGTVNYTSYAPETYFQIERVADFSAGRPVGHSLATATQPGLVKAGYVEDFQTQSNVSYGVGNHSSSFCQIELTPGTWIINVHHNTGLSVSSTGTGDFGRFSVTTSASDNDNAGSIGDTKQEFAMNGGRGSGSLTMRVTVESTTTYHMHINSYSSAGGDAFNFCKMVAHLVS